MMAIREDLVSSAAQFLQDPSVASSSVENRISFLRTKNLTPEEIDAALARAGGGAPPTSVSHPNAPSSGPSQSYYPPYTHHAWQLPPAPKRDWRDWFIMATVVGGVSYGLYSLGKRYVYPLIAPPTPDRLESDKKLIEEQFDKAFALVEQLSNDTEALKNAEKQRTERLDVTISDLETVMAELKSASRRREDDAQRIRDEVQALKDAIPKAMSNQKDLTDNRLSEINTELASLKTLVSQRMSPSTSTSAAGSYLRGINGTVLPSTSSTTRLQLSSNETATEPSSTPTATIPKTLSQTSSNKVNGSPISSGVRASIPAWQMAMANQTTESSVSTDAEKVAKEQEASPGSS